MREVWDAAEAGDLERAREVDSSLRPLFEALAVTTNPMPIKAALAMVGTIPSETVRLPMVELDESQRDVVRAALEGVGLMTTAG
jgi:4-hydroxy-tetrahydrodipicolinate synthase